MLFSVVPYLPRPEQHEAPHIYLVPTDWDDWFKFCTLFSVYVIDQNGVKYEAGQIKIGEAGLQPRGRGGDQEPGFRQPTLPANFDQLNESHFSVGQSDNYYETLNELPPDFRNTILTSLRDFSFDLSIYEMHRHELVVSESLLRDIHERNVRNRFHRLSHGNAELTRFEFSYTFPNIHIEGIDPPTLTFLAEPESQPPSNVHVLIGRNGVGKTKCVKELSQTIVGWRGEGDSPGELRRLGDNADEWSFSGLLLVSFSIFDDFVFPADEHAEVHPTKIGLPPIEDLDEIPGQIPRSLPNSLAQYFTKSFALCRHGPRKERWRSAVTTLETDPLFAEANISSLLDFPDDAWKEVALRTFKKLSSGHAIVLLTTTRLVELVDERTLVVMDEPEGHLHPPLLSAFIRTISDLLVKRNGIAIIATHSPVILQEVPKSCVWKLRRSGAISVAERPNIETFGENVGTLTREIFGLEVTNSGFHRLLKNAAENHNSYDECLGFFNEQLGGEARAILMNLFASRGIN